MDMIFFNFFLVVAQVVRGKRLALNANFELTIPVCIRSADVEYLIKNGRMFDLVGFELELFLF